MKQKRLRLDSHPPGPSLFFRAIISMNAFVHVRVQCRKTAKVALRQAEKIRRVHFSNQDSFALEAATLTTTPSDCLFIYGSI